MQGFADSLLHGGLLTGMPVELGYALVVALFAFLVLNFIMLNAGIFSWAERRIWARIQSRVGPNRVGPQGFLQWLADGLKNIMKEDLIPEEADAPLFKAAPYLAMMGFFAAFAALPFAQGVIVADLNVGILYITAVTALVVVGILMAGWSSNNKWALLGGIRSAAQIISYEIPAGLAVVTVVIYSGTLSMQGIIEQQGWAPWNWYMFSNPFLMIAFFIFFVSLLAEGNRTPFDLPEAESELVAGAFTEYSGLRNLLFFLVEWGNLYVIGAICATLFLGGWQVPAFTENAVLLGIAQCLSFFIKTYFLVFLCMWIRGTLPRVRVDQLMTLCWKYLVPMTFVNLICAMLYFVLFPQGNLLVSLTLFGLGVGVVVYFFRRVAFHLRRAKPEIHLSPFI
ncbi:MAG: NADH-quinone oxidoreductase subunit NuoH [Candidatus Binatia bacterium]|nr:NADH-quinone oxidoreductase subunit NuoH [Candidatus Binatia bacterium]MDG2011690.1 NADH-quinone oxidoreductase subunit NuoH [Candidatus Binatia bacterium]